MTDMLTQAWQRAVVHHQFLALIGGQFVNDIERMAYFVQFPLQPEKIPVKKYVLLVGAVKIAFGKAQVVNSIQQVGFTHAVITYDTVDLLLEVHCPVFMVLKIKEYDFVEKHYFWQPL